jgi:putative ABC transport system ATP-binding protein
VLFRLNETADTTLVLVTHDQELASRTERVLRLRGGSLVGDERQAATDAQAVA